MTTIAIIPARSGSKGVPGKNKKLLFGKPLIQWTIEAALNAREIDKVLVTSDDAEIRELAFLSKTLVYVRPPILATDDCQLDDVYLWTKDLDKIDQIKESYLKWQHDSPNLVLYFLGLYEMNRPVSEVRLENPRILETMVLRRVLWVVPWEWMKQFPASDTKGKTKNSSWENTLRYPKLRNLPKITETYRVKKGLVHLTQGVDPEYFSFLRTN